MKARASREGTSLEETVRSILRAAVVDEEPLGTVIRRIVGRGSTWSYPSVSSTRPSTSRPTTTAQTNPSLNARDFEAIDLSVVEPY